MNLKSFGSRKTFSFSIKIILPIVLLCIIGLITLYSTIILPEGGIGDTSILTKQIALTIVGVILFIIVSLVDLSYLRHWQLLLVIYLCTLLLLLATLLWGPVINNVQRWLIIAGVQVQPSEIAKLTVIIITAATLSFKDKYNELIVFLISFLLVIPIILLIYLQPSGSMMALTLGIWFLLAFLGLNNPLRNSILLIIILCISGSFLLSSVTGNQMWFLLIIPALTFGIFGFYAKNNWKAFVVLATIIGLVVGIFANVAWRNILKDYQKNRIEAFLNPEETETDIGFNVNQSRIAIGSGQLFGKGFGNGTQSKRNFVPEYQTDFIFASYAEEFGLVGCIFLLILYSAIIIICFTTAIKCSSNTMLSLIAVGIGIKLLFEVFINIGTNMGTIPATGIPLPLMSAGGTSIFVTLLGLGILQNVYSKAFSKLKTEKKDILQIYED